MFYPIMKKIILFSDFKLFFKENIINNSHLYNIATSNFK